MFIISKELQSEIRRYSARIAYDIHSRRKREEVKREYAEHLEDAVYYRIVQYGMEEMDAFRDACEELGDVNKIQELLAMTHNQDSHPTAVKVALCLLAAVLLGASYFLINNESYRSYFIVTLQISIFVLGVIALLHARLYLRAIRIRARAYRQLKKYAVRNGHTFIRRANSYRSVFHRTTTPEWIYETDTECYILSLFATVRHKKALRISDTGLYSYEDNIAFSLVSYDYAFCALNFATSQGSTATQNYFFAISDISTFSRGTYLMPDIQWKIAEHPTKKNIHVLLLNPIPSNTFLVERGHARESGSCDHLGDLHIYSASGLISTLEGYRLCGKRDDTKTHA
ncbi:MAG: hypothetical protein IJW40_07765 [Clostridia bacterium]|nr:hypothetical protein [Clostridia bacterium]